MRKWNMVQRFSLITLVGLILLLMSPYVSADPGPSECLIETMECKFTPELSALAQELAYNPVKIYNWVYENIEYKWYLASRMGAQSAYLTRRGNEWDQSSLLITLLRKSGIPARYVLMNDVNPDLRERQGCVYVEAWLPLPNYRGAGASLEKGWVPLAPWSKEYRIQEGIDLFPNGTIPSELGFDFSNYMSSQKQETTIELFEEKVQSYLAANYPGKSLNDVIYKETVVKHASSILPATLPQNISASTNETRFAEVPNGYRVSNILQFKKADGSVLLERTVYLPEIAGKRLCVDFAPATSSDAQITASYGGMCKTPSGAAQLKPLLKLDGQTIAEGSSLATGDFLYPSYKIIIGPYWQTNEHNTAAQKAGSFIIMACDELTGSSVIIERMKAELKDIPVSLASSDQNREQYLGRVAQIYMTTCLIRMYENLERATELMHCRRKYGESMTLIYTFPSNVASEMSTKFLIHPSWATDGLGLVDRVYRASAPDQFLDFNGPVCALMGSLVGNTTSYNEGNIYEDWQDTEGFNTVKGIMVAHEQGIQVLDINQSNLSQSVATLQSQPVDVRIPQSTIDNYIIPKVNDGMSLTIPVRILNYEGILGFVILAYRGNNFEGGLQYILNDTNGGLSTSNPIQYNPLEPSSNYAPTIDPGLWAEYTVTDEDLQTMVDMRDENPEAKNLLNEEERSAGDPVDMVTGEFYHEETPDIEIKSRGFDLTIKRKYRSRVVYNGLFGHNWVWNHTEKIIPMTNGDLVYMNQDCLPYYLTLSGSSYQYPAGTTFRVEKVGDTYVATHKSLQKYYFSAEGFLTKKEDSLGNSLTFEYDANHKLISVKDSLNRALTFTYNVNGKAEHVTDFEGRYCQYEYDGDDLVSFTDLQGNTTHYDYLKNQDNPLCNHNMKKYILPNGDYLEIAYYKNDTVAYHTNGKGETFNFQYSPLNRYGETWNEAGYYRKVFFNETQDVIRVSNEDGTIETMEWDANHNKISRTDGNGFTTTFTYDANRNMTSKRIVFDEQRVEEWLYEYDSNNKVTSIRDPKGNFTPFEYYANGALWKKIEAPEYAYDPEGRLVSTPEAPGFVTTYGYDTSWNLTTVTDPTSHSLTTSYDAQKLYPVSTQDKNGNTTTLTYNTLGNLIHKVDPEGKTTEYEYNGYNQVTKTRDHYGKETIYEYDVNRNLTRKIDPNGAVTQNIYDTTRDLVAGAKIVKTVDPLGKFEFYDYDEVGNMILKKDKNGNRYRYVYDGMNRVVEEYDPYDSCISYAYDGNGKLVAKWDKRENRTTFTYDKAGRKVSMTDGEEKTWTYAYDLNGNLLSETSPAPNNIVILYAYDALNRLVSKTLASGTADQRVYQFRYDVLGRIVKAIQPLGNYEVYTYDNNVNRTKVESYDRNNVKLKEETFVYDSRNLLVSRTDGRGKTWFVEYDALGRKVAEVDPIFGRVDFTYDVVGNVTKVTDQLGNATKHFYELAKRRVKSVDALDQITSYRYDPIGNLVGVTDPRGNETVTHYDALNRKIGVQNALGNTTTFDYDENGNLASWAKPAGDSKYFTYDRNNRPILESDPDSLYQTHYTYDSLGRVEEITDPRGIKTRMVYNEFGQKKEMREAFDTTSQALTTFAYDSNGNLTSMTNARNVTLSFTYDDLNRKVREYDADGTYREATYDGNGNVTTERKRDGSLVTRTYDDLNRLVEVNSGGQLQQTFQYDWLSRMTQAVDRNENKQSHTVSFEYDALHRLLAEVQDGRRVEREFDPNGNVLRLHYPSGKIVEKEYNALNRPTFISDNTGDIAGLGWDANNRPALIAPATTNQVEGVITYNNRGLEWKRDYKTNAEVVVYSMETSYDAGENILKETIQGRTNLVKDYTVDNLERLVQEQRDSVVAAVWGYDGVGNWLSTTQNGSSESRVANSDNEYTSITGMSPQYDANGNLTSDGTKQYVYDWANRLVEVRESGQQVARYTYDGLNRRVTKYVNQTSVLTTYVHDGSQIIEEHESSVLARSYVYGAYVDDPLMMEDPQGNSYFYLKDRQYSVTAIVNGAGQVVERYEYGAFGLMNIYNAEGQEITESQIGNIYGYTGRQWDKESRLWYYRNRMYSATLGRFLQRDPAGYVDGVNLYAYVRNNPLKSLDPSGTTTRKQESLDLAMSAPDVGSISLWPLDIIQRENPSPKPILVADSAMASDARENWFDAHPWSKKEDYTFSEYKDTVRTGNYRVVVEYSPVNPTLEIVKDSIRQGYNAIARETGLPPIPHLPTYQERRVYVESTQVQVYKVSEVKYNSPYTTPQEYSRVPLGDAQWIKHDNPQIYRDYGWWLFSKPGPREFYTTDYKIDELMLKLMQYHGAERYIE